MPFSFVYPLFLIGLAAGAIPWILELLHRARLPVVPFPSIRFLGEVQRDSRRRTRLRDILILILRTLGIWFLAIGLARPTIPKAGLGPIVPGEEAVVALLLDNTASMGFTEEGVSMLARAKEAALAIADALQSRDRVVFYPFQPGKEPGRAGIIDRAGLEEAVRSTETVASGGDLRGVLERSLDEFDRSDRPNREVYIVSDMQRTTWSGLGAGFTDRPDRPRVFICPIISDEQGNLGITGIGRWNGLLLPRTSITVGAVVTGSGTTRGSDLPKVSLFSDDEKVAEKGIDPPSEGRSSAELSFYIPRPGTFRCRLELSDDAMSVDNHFHFVIKVPETIRVGLFGSSRATALVRAALAPEGVERSGIELDILPSIGPGALDSSDVLVLSDPPPPTRSAAAEIHRFAEQGGGVLIIPGAGTVDRHFNQTLLPGLMDVRLIGALRADVASGGAFLVDRCDYDHPVLAPFRLKPFDSTNQSNSPRIKLMFRLETGRSVKTPILATGGRPLLTESAVGRGRAALLAIGLDRSFSDLSVRGMFVPLMHLLTHHLAGLGRQLEPVTAGEDLLLDAGTWQPEQDLFVETPDGSRIRVIPETTAGFPRVRLAGPNSPGFYSLVGPAGEIDVQAVNAEPGESDLRRISEKEVELALGQTEWLDPSSELTKAIRSARLGNEFGRHFLILALVALTAELLIALGGRKVTKSEGHKV